MSVQVKAKAMCVREEVCYKHDLLRAPEQQPMPMPCNPALHAHAAAQSAPYAVPLILEAVLP